jgi:hypothetical protein
LNYNLPNRTTTFSCGQVYTLDKIILFDFRWFSGKKAVLLERVRARLRSGATNAPPTPQKTTSEKDDDDDKGWISCCCCFVVVVD